MERGHDLRFSAEAPCTFFVDIIMKRYVFLNTLPGNTIESCGECTAPPAGRTAGAAKHY